MYEGSRVGVVVPAYNEARFVGDVIETLPEFVDRIYPVDDCSTDGTRAEIRRAARRVNARQGAEATDDERATAETAATRSDGGGEDCRVVPVYHDDNRGVGGAIKSGYLRAIEDDLDVVAVVNGDGQMDPDILHRILDPVVEGTADYAKGNRLLSADHWRGMSLWRLFGNFVLTHMTRIASGYWQMTDPQNGYTAISTEALERVDVPSLYDDYGFLNDLLVKLNTHDMRIADVEMRAVYGDEVSSIRYSRFIPQLLWLLVSSLFWRLKAKYLGGDFHPLVLSYLTGAVGGVVLLLSVPLAVLAPSLALGGWLATAAGLLCCSVLLGVGMLLDRRHNLGLETRVRK